MAKNVYYQGKLIPAKDWDYETKKPKAKAGKKAEVIAESEPQTEVILEVVVEELPE